MAMAARCRGVLRGASQRLNAHVHTDPGASIRVHWCVVRRTFASNLGGGGEGNDSEGTAVGGGKDKLSSGGLSPQLGAGFYSSLVRRANERRVAAGGQAHGTPQHKPLNVQGGEAGGRLMGLYNDEDDIDSDFVAPVDDPEYPPGREVPKIHTSDE